MSPLQGWESPELDTFFLGLHPRLRYFALSGLFACSYKFKNDLWFPIYFGNLPVNIQAGLAYFYP